MFIGASVGGGRRVSVANYVVDFLHGRCIRPGLLIGLYPTCSILGAATVRTALKHLRN